MKKKIKMLGMFKVWQQRLATYIGMINFFMIFYLYIVESPLGIEWYHWLILILLSVIIIIYVDIKYIFPSTQLYAFNKNPGWMAIKQQVDENSAKLDILLKKMEEQ